ncbi:ankyrin [Cadophora sp. DSE1049]|nr:ankyrin [Cadophora sp. DSE1049]
MNCNTIRCWDCDTSFTKPHLYNKHRKTHDRPHACALCDKSFSLKTGLERHRSTHSNTRAILKCRYPHCNFRGTSRKDYLSAHLRKYHANEEKLGDPGRLPYNDEKSFAEQQQLRQEEKNVEFLECVSRGDKESVERLLSDSTSAQISAQDSARSTALHLCIAKGHLNLIVILLQAGLDIEMSDLRYGTALHLAVAQKKYDAMQILLDNGANINSINRKNETMLHGAASRGDEALVELLINSKADCETESRLSILGGLTMGTALHNAAEGGHVGTARLLLAGGAGVESLTKHTRKTPLHLAVHRGHLAMARLLLENAADANSSDSYTHTPLDLAQTLEMVKILLEANAQVVSKTLGSRSLSFEIRRAYLDRSRGRTAREESTKLLLAAGAKFSLRDWEFLSHDYKQMFAKYRPAGVEQPETSDPAIVPWNVESDENYAEIVRRYSGRGTGQ